ncbi:hypothetical protein, partial [Phenylobacterium sp.]|uniref:hypothetical protein n=1 Tax=Phenylobacterium sp. TaxID=1871053 RepID=UPI002F3F029A
TYAYRTAQFLCRRGVSVFLPSGAFIAASQHQYRIRNPDASGRRRINEGCEMVGGASFGAPGLSFRRPPRLIAQLLAWVGAVAQEGRVLRRG